MTKYTHNKMLLGDPGSNILFIIIILFVKVRQLSSHLKAFAAGSGLCMWLAATTVYLGVQLDRSAEPGAQVQALRAPPRPPHHPRASGRFASAEAAAVRPAAAAREL